MTYTVRSRGVVHVLLLALMMACRGAADAKPAPGPSRYLYVWAGTGDDTTRGIDMMTVIDADPASSGYGTVRAALTLDSAGHMPHHTEFSAPPNGILAANDYSGDKSYLVDFRTPATPRLDGRLDPVPGGRRLHSFERLDNGHLLATVQFSTDSGTGHPGALAEFDEHGKLLRTAWSRDSAFPGARIRTYALAVVKSADRIVTTSSPMDNETTADVVQVWRLSDLTLLKTLSVPVTAGDSAHKYPFEVRALPDGSVMLNTYYCGFYRVSGIETEQPRLDLVHALNEAHAEGCAVAVVMGHYWIVPAAFARTIVSFDVSDPTHPVEVSRLQTDSTFYPHWLSTDPASDRIVVGSADGGAPRVLVARMDRTTGTLTWDERFHDAGSSRLGVDLDRPELRRGAASHVMGHAALFGPAVATR